MCDVRPICANRELQKKVRSSQIKVRFIQMGVIVIVPAGSIGVHNTVWYSGTHSTAAPGVEQERHIMKRVFGKKKDVGPAPSLSDAGGRVDERVTKIDEKARIWNRPSAFRATLVLPRHEHG